MGLDRNPYIVGYVCNGCVQVWSSTGVPDNTAEAVGAFVESKLACGHSNLENVTHIVVGQRGGFGADTTLTGLTFYKLTPRTGYDVERGA